jgi:hypothetical protein
MDTPPCSYARRLGQVPDGASLIPPPEACDRQGVFSAWCSPSIAATTIGGLAKSQTSARGCSTPRVLRRRRACSSR